MRMAVSTVMAETRPEAAGHKLYKLMSWLSPAFPVGAFAYSGGLERAVHDGIVRDVDDLADWVGVALDHGAVRTDAILVSLAYRADGDDEALRDLLELAIALSGSRERHGETIGVGAAFLAAVGGWSRSLPPALTDGSGGAPYPVVLGAAAGIERIPLDWVLTGYQQAFVAQAGSVAIRLGVTGQVGAVALQAAMEARIGDAVAGLLTAGIDDLGSAAVIGEISMLRHETQAVRLFRS